MPANNPKVPNQDSVEWLWSRVVAAYLVLAVVPIGIGLAVEAVLDWSPHVPLVAWLVFLVGFTAMCALTPNQCGTEHGPLKLVAFVAICVFGGIHVMAMPGCAAMFLVMTECSVESDAAHNIMVKGTGYLLMGAVPSAPAMWYAMRRSTVFAREAPPASEAPAPIS